MLFGRCLLLLSLASSGFCITPHNGPKIAAQLHSLQKRVDSLEKIHSPDREQLNATSDERIVDSVSMGALSDVETVQFTIRNFELVTDVEGQEEYLESPVVKAHGREWKIRLYPRGEGFYSLGYMSCYLFLHSESTTVRAKHSLRCRGCNKDGGINEFTPVHAAHFQGWGWRRFIRRNDVLKNFLEDDGSFVIRADIQLSEETFPACSAGFRLAEEKTPHGQDRMTSADMHRTDVNAHHEQDLIPPANIQLAEENKSPEQDLKPSIDVQHIDNLPASCWWGCLTILYLMLTLL